MAYSQGGLIQATDYNGFINGSNQLNTVWGVGTGNAGYGQTAISAVTAAGVVTAAQWATLINTLNSTLTHQSGSGSGISATTAGSKINYLSTLATNINTAYTNRLNKATTGSTSTGSNFAPNPTAAGGSAYGAYVSERTVTFATGDAARYFFNAGGSINFVVSSVTNNDGTARSTDAVNVINTYFKGINAFKAASNGQATGTGGTQTGSYTSGYYGLTTSPQLISQITTASSTYSGDYVALNVYSNGTQGSNGDKGTVITFTLTYYSAHTSTTSGLYGSSGDTLNVSASMRIDVVPPETTNLSNTWGTVTIA